MFNLASLNKLLKLVNEGHIIYSIRIDSKDHDFSDLKNHKIQEIEDDGAVYQVIYGDKK